MARTLYHRTGASHQEDPQEEDAVKFLQLIFIFLIELFQLIVGVRKGVSLQVTKEKKPHIAEA